MTSLSSDNRVVGVFNIVLYPHNIAISSYFVRLISKMAPSADSTTNGVHDQVDGLNGTNGASHVPLNEYTIPLNKEYAYTPRRLRVVTIGAGFSGLIMAHKFQHRFPEMQEFVDHTIYERNSQLGGTWLVNTYPGVQCDVPSHIYVRQQTHKTQQTIYLSAAGISIRSKPELVSVLFQWRRN